MVFNLLKVWSWCIFIFLFYPPPGGQGAHIISFCLIIVKLGLDKSDINHVNQVMNISTLIIHKHVFHEKL